MELFGTMNIKNNQLFIGGVSTLELSKEFGTPLYVFDEELIRENCSSYKKHFNVESGNKVAYAGKAFLTLAICQIIKDEGLCLDVVSGGELYTAYKSNFPMEKIYFHGNNKTIEEITMGVEYGVGTFVVDNFYEIDKINEIAKKLGKVQGVMLRVTPGIEAHTHDYIKTGAVDSKFGFTMLNNKVLSAVKKVSGLSSLKFTGLHCHIGSQIFDIEPYLDEVDIMMELSESIKKETGVDVLELNLGGGFGIYYKSGDSPRSIEEYCTSILNRARENAARFSINPPSLVIEPGRSIIGNAGITLYTIGSMKYIPNIKKYASVDGGMADNIRPALYNASYECILANRVESIWKDTITISGKCCESGDILMKDIELPECFSGDILAVMSTGAYGYSMASNYNKIPRAAAVFIKDGTSKLIARRETYEDVIRRELPL